MKHLPVPFGSEPDFSEEEEFKPTRR
jgi:hypothetical protein